MEHSVKGGARPPAGSENDGGVEDMKVKAIKDYNDLELKRLVVKDEELTVSAERGAVLINAMVAVEIAKEIPETIEEPKPKAKKGKKKVADE